MRNLKHKKDGTTAAFGRLPLALAVIAVCTQGYAADATKDKAGIPFSPFAYLSLNLQNFSESSGGNGFPAKIMLMIDDSGSMADSPMVFGGNSSSLYCPSYSWPVSSNGYMNFVNKRNQLGLPLIIPSDEQLAVGSNCYFCMDGTKPTMSSANSVSCSNGHQNLMLIPTPAIPGNEASKFDIARNALVKILRNKDYKDKFYWSFISLNNKTTQKPSPYTLDSYSIINNQMSILSPSGGTPSTSRYMDAFTHVVKNMEHVCQKNYIIVLSDGDSYLDEPVNADNYFLRNSNKPSTIREVVGYSWYQNRKGRFLQATGGTDKAVPSFFGALPANYSADGYQPIKDEYKYIPYTWPQWKARGQQCPNGFELLSPGNGLHNLMTGSQFLCLYDDPNVYEEDHGIAFFSKRLASKDVKSPKNEGIFYGDKDKEGLDWDDASFPPQTIKTYTIGFGSGLSAIGKAYLKNAASMLDTDGDKKDDTVGFFSALSQKELDHAFGLIVEDINNNGAIALKPTDGYSVSSPAISSTKDGGFGIALTLNTASWSSQLRFTKLDKNGSIIKKKVKDANGVEKEETEHVDADYSSRKIIVNDGTKNTWIDAADAPKADFYGFSKEQENDFAQYFKPWYTRSSNISDPAIRDGAAKLAATAKKVAQYRVRAEKADDPQRMMADVLGTPIIALGYDEATKSQKYVMTAANDGMVYIFKAQSGNTPYKLALNYLPAAMERESVDGSDTVAKALASTAEEGYGKTVKNKPIDAQPHLFLNNGGMQWRATSGDKSGIYVAGAMGQGGRGAYVLAVSGKDRITGGPIGLDTGEVDWVKTVPLWETAKGADNLLGYTMGTPQFGQVATKYNGDRPNYGEGIRQYLFLANGYHGSKGEPVPNSPVKLDNGPTLYIYEALGLELSEGKEARNGRAAGDLIAKLTVKDGVGGLSTPVLVDTDRDFLFDHAYAGDQGGNLYRFTFNKENVAEWTVHKIYQGNTSQPITAQPAIYRGRDEQDNKLVIIVGTGSDVYQEDLESKDQQVVLGIFDDVNDKDPKTLTSNDLVKQEAKTVKNGEKTLIDLSNNPMEDKKGWQLLLPLKGERVVTQAMLINKTAFFTSRIYDSTTDSKGSKPDESSAYSCKTSETKIEAKGESWIYGVDVLTGSNPKKESAYFENLLEGDNGKNGGNGNAGKKDDKQPAGYKLDGGLSSGLILPADDENRPTTQHGTSQTGKDVLIGAADGSAGGGPKITDTSKSDCRPRKYGNPTADLVTEEEGSQQVHFGAGFCPESARLIRINTREIKESVQ